MRSSVRGGLAGDGARVSSMRSADGPSLSPRRRRSRRPDRAGAVGSVGGGGVVDAPSPRSPRRRRLPRRPSRFSSLLPLPFLLDVAGGSAAAAVEVLCDDCFCGDEDETVAAADAVGELPAVYEASCADGNIIAIPPGCLTAAYGG